MDIVAPARRTFLVGGFGFIAAAAGERVARAATRQTEFARFAVIDGTGWPLDPDTSRITTPVSPEWVLSLRRSGLTAMQVTVGRNANDEEAFSKSVKFLSDHDHWLDINREYALKATRAEDILRAKREKKLALIYAFQNSDMIGAELDRVELFRNLGVRCVQLTYNMGNQAGSGALDKEDIGLTALGRTTIERLEFARVVVDFAHGSRLLMQEGARAARRPPLISHTGCRALVDHPRNTTDPIIRSVADKGGVVGIYFMPFLAHDARATKEDLIRHLEHAVAVAGEDHVSIGTDGFLEAPVLDATYLAGVRNGNAGRARLGINVPFEEKPDFIPLIRDYNDPGRLQMLAGDLSARGWPTARIEKILGLNLLRLYREIWGA